MTDINLASPVEVIINDILYSGTAFGHVALTGANCVIPSRVLGAIGDSAVEGSRHNCMLVPNPQEDRRGDTPYAVSYVIPEGYTPPAPAAAPEPDLSDLPLFAASDTPPDMTVDVVKAHIMRMLEENAYITLPHAVDYIEAQGGTPDKKLIGNALDRLWRSKTSGVARYSYSLSADGCSRNSAYTLNPMGLTYKHVGEE